MTLAIFPSGGCVNDVVNNREIISLLLPWPYIS